MAFSGRIDEFDDDVKIVHIGNLFKYENNPRWYINLWFNPFQEKNFVSFSQIPLLARSRILNQTDRADSQVDTGSVNFTNQVYLEEIKLSECPVLELERDSIRKFEGREWGFKFKQQNGLTVYLPQLELARVLFLTSSYLSRAAMSTADLINDFDVHTDLRADKAVINVMGTTSFPMRAFNYTAVRNMIAWILLDPNARGSFTSIARNLNVESVFNKTLRTWSFRFTPPDLKGWELGYKGKLDRASKSLLVYEITALDIVPDIPFMVEFRHPTFIDYKMVGSLDSKETGSYRQRPDDIVIDDEGSSSSRSEPVIMRNTAARISFKKPFQTKKQTEEKKIKGKAEEEGEGSEVVIDSVSTAEPEVGGDLQAADFASGENETDYTEFCEDRFSGFFRMLEVLEEKHSCKIFNKITNELPNAGRSKKHLLKKRGTPRMICCVTVVRKGTQFKILEIDTSDGIRMLSTRVVMGGDDKDWEKNYSDLKQLIITSSLTWPISYLNEVFGEDCHVGIVHPSNKASGKGNIPWDSIPGWARRVSERLV